MIHVLIIFMTIIVIGWILFPVILDICYDSKDKCYLWPEYWFGVILNGFFTGILIYLVYFWSP